MKLLKACVRQLDIGSLIAMLQGSLACGVHGEYILARGTSVRHCARLLTVVSCDQNFLLGLCTVMVFCRLNGKCHCKNKNARLSYF